MGIHALKTISARKGFALEVRGSPVTMDSAARQIPALKKDVFTLRMTPLAREQPPVSKPFAPQNWAALSPLSPHSPVMTGASVPPMTPARKARVRALNWIAAAMTLVGSAPVALKRAANSRRQSAFHAMMETHAQPVTNVTLEIARDSPLRTFPNALLNQSHIAQVPRDQGMSGNVFCPLPHPRQTPSPPPAFNSP